MFRIMFFFLQHKIHPEACTLELRYYIWQKHDVKFSYLPFRIPSDHRKKCLFGKKIYFLLFAVI